MKNYQPPHTITPAIIHLIADISATLGRLWQTLILSWWNPPLAILPVESMVHAQQREYYQAINHSTQQTDSAPFIEFVLGAILQAIDSASPQVAP